VAQRFNGIKNLFFDLFMVFLCVLLFCKLRRKELDELVYVMQCNPNCSMKTFHELCESQFCKEIGKNIFGERRDEVMRSIFYVS